MKKHAKRDKLNIIYDVLVCCSINPVISSDIARKANVNNFHVRRLTEDLVAYGFLSKRILREKTCYFTSNSGRDYVKKYSDLLTMAKPLLPSSNR
jgi:predicted transcriptional regulator